MMEITNITFNTEGSLISNESDFHKVLMEMNNSDIDNQNIENNDNEGDDKLTEEEMVDIITQSTITNQTISMLKQHEESMKELLDE